ncbi:hypothetical protein Tco_1316158 [Tanacetum coccineum]
MGIMRTIVMICMMILVVMGTTMASKPFPFDERPDEVCCYPGYPCCTHPFPPLAVEDHDSVEVNAPSPFPLPLPSLPPLPFFPPSPSP